MKSVADHLIYTEKHTSVALLTPVYGATEKLAAYYKATGTLFFLKYRIRGLLRIIEKKYGSTFIVIGSIVLASKFEGYITLTFSVRDFSFFKGNPVKGVRDF